MMIYKENNGNNASVTDHEYCQHVDLWHICPFSELF